MNRAEANARQLILRQRKRRERSAFASLVSDPSAAEITLPAGARLAIRNEGTLASTTVALTIGARTISMPASAPGGWQIVDWLPAGSVVSISTGFTLLLDIGLGAYDPIGSNP